MKKQTKMVVIAAVAIATSLSAAVVAVNQVGGFAGLAVFATQTRNDYGCVSNCTGEYYPTHLNSILVNRPDLNETENVRLIAKVSKTSTWLQDIDDENVYKGIRTDAFRDAYNHRRLVQIQGAISGLTYKAGDIIGFYGTVTYDSSNCPCAIIQNPVVYKVNDTADLSLLQPVVYLQ